MSDDDYMTMTFEDDYASAAAGSKKRKPVETSLQRRMRLEREGRARGRVLSKAEQARATEEQREAALGRSLFAGGKDKTSTSGAPPSKGLAMMAKMGFVAGQALGKKRTASTEGDGKGGGDDKDRPITEPIRIHVKRDRAGIGARDDKKEKEKLPDKRPAEIDPDAYRDRIRLEREEARLERQIHAAQVVAERLASGEDDDNNTPNRDDQPLTDVNVLWRGMVQQRRERERERVRRIQGDKVLDRGLHGLSGGTGSKTGEDSDDDRGADVPGSYLKTGLSSVVVEEDDDDNDNDNDNKEDDVDSELAEFAALPAQDRLQQVVDWMRLNRRYCFWCKHTYATDDLDGCPGPTEADHD